MNTFKGWISTTVLAALLLASASSTYGGIIIGGGDIKVSTPCGATKDDVEINTKDLGGIIFGGLTGIIFGGFGPAVLNQGSSDTDVDCGIIFGG